MKSIATVSSSPKENWQNRIRVADTVSTRGTNQRTDPPRDIQAQPSSRGALVTWKLPATRSRQIAGWRVYLNDEHTLFQSINDRAVRQCLVTLTSGASPQSYNIFVSSVNSYGSESVKARATAKATAESGAPAVPSPPPGYTQEISGGADRRRGAKAQYAAVTI
jgi:hypothetical protein